MDKLLTKFLEVNLLPQLKTNEQFAHLESAINEVNKILAKNQVNLISFTLAALHPNISKEDAAVKDVDLALKKHWKTVQNNISEEPRQIWRTIIWESLNYQAKDTTSAAVIWLTAASIFPHSELDANEREIITEFLLSLRSKVEVEADSLWRQSNGDAPQGVDFDSSLTKPEIKSALDNGFKTDLVKAAGPTDAAGNSLEGANPNWANGNQAWSDAFADRASKAIARRINASATNLRDDLYSQLEELFGELKGEISRFSENLAAGQVNRNLRDKLLWWRQTLYSPTLEKSYRELEPIVAALYIAFDLHQLLDGIYPVSVEYLMCETFRAAEIEDSGKKFSVKTILEKLAADPNSKIVDGLTVNYYKNFSKPMPLASIVKKSIGSNRMSEEDFNLLGLNPGAEITLSEFSVWIIRDLQAHRLANKK